MNSTWVMTGATALIATAIIAVSAAGVTGRLGTNTRADNAIAVAMLVIGIPLGPWLYTNGQWDLIAVVFAAWAVAAVPWATSVPIWVMVAAAAGIAIGIWWLAP